MTLLDKLCDPAVWEQYRQHLLSQDRLSEKEQSALDEYVEQKRYLPLAQTLEFSLPSKKTINKSGAAKKRVIYTFPSEQTYILKLLTTLLYKYDSFFCDSCYSFRKGITAHTALKKLTRLPGLEKSWVLKLDIHNYFNSMPSKLLARELENVITDDPPLLAFLADFFTADKACSGETIIEENRGAMAGVPLSAFCANLYLTDLDRLFEKMGADYFRYSDDILVLAHSKEKAMAYYDLIKTHVESKGLTLNPDKFTLTPPGDPWEFLGFRYHRGEIDLSDAALRKMKSKIKRKAATLYRRKSKRGTDPDKAASAMIKIFNKKFYFTDNKTDLNWSRWYFPLLTTHKRLAQLDRCLLEHIRFIYTGRHYKGNYRITYAHIKSLGFRSLVNEFYRPRQTPPSVQRNDENES